jgi:hypothetical protein
LKDRIKWVADMVVRSCGLEQFSFEQELISPTQRPLPDSTNHVQETDIHDPGGIRNRNPSKRAAADPRLSPRGYWDRQMEYNDVWIMLSIRKLNIVCTVILSNQLFMLLERCTDSRSQDTCLDKFWTMNGGPPTVCGFPVQNVLHITLLSRRSLGGDEILWKFVHPWRTHTCIHIEFRV